MPLSVDAREVLAILNDMGYRNISAEQLKEFIKDLKKLIKYEDRLCVPHISKKEDKVTQRYEQLYKTSTTSFQAKIKQQKHIENTENECKDKISEPKDPIKIKRRRSKSAPRNLGKLDEMPVQNLNENKKEYKKRSKSQEKKPMPMWIRPKSACASSTGRRPHSDPVQLYQYYKDEWRKFRQNLPGENDHTELRWAIRHKLLKSDC